ncbi:MAG: hypothetical protein KTR15_09400 [Phycisphaeraceae bacterium]|nr:hypothetical protein [Phycisphaeraceae bacterium]
MRHRVQALLTIFVCALGTVCFAPPHALADDLKGLKVPVYRDRDGYGLAVTEYSLQTEAELLDDEAPEHTLELAGLLQPPGKADVLCFSTTVVAKSVEDARGRDLMLPQRKRNNAKKFRALVPSLKFKDRRGDPLYLCESELESISLDRPGTEVDKLVVVATAVIVKDRETEEISADVADRYNDVGFGTSVQVSAIEVDKKSEMTVRLNVKHTGNKDLPVVDSVYALDKRGKPMGGGRWSNELELFGKRYEVELVFPLRGDEKSIDKFQIVLATEYDIEQVELTIEGLFQK